MEERKGTGLAFHDAPNRMNRGKVRPERCALTSGNRSPDEIRIIVSDFPDFIERKDADRFILALSEDQAVVQFNHLDPL